MSSTRWWIAAAAIGCAGIASVGTLQAQDASDIEVLYGIKEPDPGNSKTKGEAPQIAATVIGGPSLPPDKYVLVDTSVKPPVEIKATSKRAYHQGSETLALAIVMLGWEQWIGNDGYRPKDDPTRVKGVLNPLRAAFDKVSWKTTVPPGSVGMVITYSTTAQIRAPLGPLEKLGAALGTQKDYKDTVGFEMVKSIELALAELKKVSHPQKALILLTDGTDTNEQAAVGALANLRKQAQQERVRTFAIVYKAADSAPGGVVSRLTKQVSTVTTTENLGTALRAALASIADRHYLTFPGYQKGAKVGLAWDGKPHDLMLRIGKTETEPSSVLLMPAWTPPAGR